MTSPILAARGVSKGFFGNPVLREVSIELMPGRIHALLGENGAGKSTLINLISGTLRPDAGHIDVDGTRQDAFSPAEARRAGIAVVQQELSLVGDLSIAENIGLGAYPRRLGFIDYSELARRAAEACAFVGLTEPLATPVKHLAFGRRQMVEIAKALYRRPRVLILDEPTSSLSTHETRTLIGILERLREAGVAILYISHRLQEVLTLCSHVTVLKDGSVTADQPLGDIDADALVRLMVGRDPGDLFPAFVSHSGEIVVSMRGMSAGRVRGIDVDIRAGELLGIGGLVGQGQEDVLLGLYGAIPARVRTARYGALAGLPSSVGEANRRGLAYVPADRKREGLHLTHPIITNLMLPGFARTFGLAKRDRSRERQDAAGLATRLGIKGDLHRPAQALSGGNQQKVALAKWIPSEPRVLLLNDPTRGVDVETKREIYLMLRGLAAEGRAVVLLSSDTPELVHLCDRVAVIHDGRIAALMNHDEASESAIVSASMGTTHAGEAA